MDENKAVKMGTKAAADYLGLTQKTLEAYRYKRTGPKFTRLANGLCEYTQADLDAWRVIMDERHSVAA